jgi:hypothetical protein
VKLNFDPATVEEKRRDVIEAFQDINKQKRRFKGMREIIDIDDAQSFIDTRANDFLQQQGRNADRSLIIELIREEVDQDIRRIMRAIRLDCNAACKELSISLGLTSQNIGLLAEILAIAKVHPGDEELIELFISKVHQLQRPQDF